MPLRWAQEGTVQPASWASPTPSDLTSAVRISAKGGRTLSVGGAALVRGQLPGQGRYGPGCGPPQPAVGGLKIVSILGTAIDSPNEKCYPFTQRNPHVQNVRKLFLDTLSAIASIFISKIPQVLKNQDFSFSNSFTYS